MTHNFLEQLNPQQRKAVQIHDGPLLILAGAGSGKTRCLSFRTADLIRNGTAGNRILAVTFTNKAANEMKQRIESLLGNTTRIRMPEVGTFHSICVRILRQEIEKVSFGWTKQFVIFDTSDTQNLIKQLIKEYFNDEDTIKPKGILSHFSSAKNQLMDIETYTQSIHLPSHTQLAQILHTLFPKYNRKLQEHNAFDFDDLLQKTVEIFETHPEILEKYQEKWRYVMVDEYQDTNFTQYRLIRLLTDTHQNICVIGDDHQSIYSFRGADYTNILNFEKDFPNANVIKLEQNYRSTKNILSCANTLIAHNKSGRKKELWTDNSTGEPLIIAEISDEKEEGNFIAETILKRCQTQGYSFSDCAVLYRMNAQSRSIEEAFMRRQIPYQIIGGTRFFDRKEIKDLIAYLRLIYNPKDDLSCLRIINIPSRKIGASTLSILQEYASMYDMGVYEVLQYLDEIPGLHSGKKQTLSVFRNIIESFREKKDSLPISLLLERIIEDIQYEKYLDDGTSEGESRQQNVQELFSVAQKYDATEDGLASFLEGVSLIADIDNYAQGEERVTFMTVHSAKGLEFPIVFLPGWEDGIFPSSNASTEDISKLEEERRLGYVAITRAEKECIITWCRERLLFGRTMLGDPSPFLGELDQRCIQQERRESFSSFRSTRKPYDQGIAREHDILFAPPQNREEALWGSAQPTSPFATGERVRHMSFGEGTILMVSGDVLTVTFKNSGIKKMVGSVAPLTKIEETTSE